MASDRDKACETGVTVNAFALSFAILASVGWLLWLGAEYGGPGWERVARDPELDGITKWATMLSHLAPIGMLSGLLGLRMRGWWLGILSVCLGAAGSLWLLWIVYQ